MANLTAVVYSGGSLAGTVAGTVSTVDALLATGLPITQGGQTAAVKAASTAPTATDPALVVALSPNGLNPNGQTVAASSAPVVLASDQSAIPVVGNVASGVSDSGNPIKVGGIGHTANPTAVTDGQRVNSTFDKLGKQVVVNSIRDLKGSAYASLATGTETTIVAGVASTFLDVYGCVVANNSATATQVSFKDSFTGTTRFVLYVPAGDTRGFIETESAAYAQATINNAWTAVCQPSVSACLITLQYVKNT
jgi:hypothetical protein